jgi:hypothetical protein
VLAYRLKKSKGYWPSLYSTESNVYQNSHIFKRAALASLGCALCFVVGFTMIFWIEPGINLNPAQRLRFILTHGLFFQLWYFIIFVVFGGCLLILIRGIRHWTQHQESLSYHLSTLAGFIWASYTFSCGLIAIFTIEYLLSIPSEQQSSVWYVIYAIQMGMGDGIEWIGGMWLLITSLHLLRSHKNPPLLNRFGLIIGCTGCLTLIPALADAGAVFGLMQIVWFCWLAIIMFKLPESAVTSQTTTK